MYSPHTHYILHVWLLFPPWLNCFLVNFADYPLAVINQNIDYRFWLLIWIEYGLGTKFTNQVLSSLLRCFFLMTFSYLVQNISSNAVSNHWSESSLDQWFEELSSVKSAHFTELIRRAQFETLTNKWPSKDNHWVLPLFLNETISLKTKLSCG